MTTRVLPPEEWHKLAGTEAESVIPHLRTMGGHALVVEDDAGLVIGTWLLMPEWRAECLWIAPEHRGKASVGRRLLLALKRSAAALGVGYVVTGSVTPEVDRLLEHIGASPLPGRHYVIPLEVH